MSRARKAARREGIVLASLLGFGLLLLPFAVYVIGRPIFGEYEPGANAFGLAVDVWTALGGNWAAWLLVLSPYLVVQLLRAAWVLWRGRKRVTSVTDPQREAGNWRV